MKRWMSGCVTLLLLVLCITPAFAMSGQVSYYEDAQRFFFNPGSEYSPTDLFTEFKDVMPGDSLQQRIVVRNHKDNDCKVKIYLRALGAHEDSGEFLSQLQLTVTEGSDMVLFDAPADQTAQLTDWVYLGTLYSGGECELTVTLDVPVTLDNRFKALVGYLDWEFAVEELPVEPTDPSPETGDESRLWLWGAMMTLSLGMLVLLHRRKSEEK